MGKVNTSNIIIVSAMEIEELKAIYVYLTHYFDSKDLVLKKGSKEVKTIRVWLGEHTNYESSYDLDIELNYKDYTVRIRKI